MSRGRVGDKVLSSLEAAGLHPNGPASALLPKDFAPTTALGISFQDKAVDCGNLFRAAQCKLAPSVAFEPESDFASGASYLLMLVDPDAPTPEDPKFAFWRHWVLPGLQPTMSDNGGLVAETKPALTEYLGPGPKDDSKPHRYLFLLFREPGGLDLPKHAVGGDEFTERRSFDAASFIQTQRLDLVAVNWMLGAGDGWKE